MQLKRHDSEVLDIFVVLHCFLSPLTEFLAFPVPTTTESLTAVLTLRTPKQPEAVGVVLPTPEVTVLYNGGTGSFSLGFGL